MVKKKCVPRCVLCVYYNPDNDGCSCDGLCVEYERFQMHGDVEKHIKESEHHDAVNPSHYKQGEIECKDCIKAALGEHYIGFLIGNVIKYTYRYQHKNGVEDLKKAAVYLEWAIKELSNDEE
jgi:hypothetical protein